MLKGRTRALNLSVLAVSVMLCACGADTGEMGQPTTVADETPAPTSDVATPAPVAVLEMPSGSRVEFYDFETTALISQTGIAGTPLPLNLDHPLGVDELTAVWRALAPEKPVPAALAELEERLVLLPPSEQTMQPSIVEDGAEVIPGELDPSGDMLAVQEGCANGCCDYAWLSTLNYCKLSADFTAFRFMWAWFSLKSTSVALHYSLACAAVGTTNYRVAISGSGGVWSVPEGWYRTYDWAAGTTCNPFCSTNRKTVTLTTNSSTSPRAHSVCARVFH